MPCVIDISELQYNYYGIVKWRQTENEVLLGLRSQPQPGADAPALPPMPVWSGIHIYSVRSLVFRGSKNGCFLTTDFQQPWCPSMVGCGVYEISDKDEQALDVYAGVPYFYQKQTMQVQCVWDVTTRREVLHNIEAILYTLPASHPLGVPSRRYLQECKSGYDDFHFSFLPLRQALIDSSPGATHEVKETLLCERKGKSKR